MSEPQHNPFHAQHRPRNAVTGVLPDESAFQAVTQDLALMGVDLGSIEEYHGSEGVANFDVTGERHGRWAQLVRSWKNMGGADANVFSRYDEAVRQGHVLVMLPMLANHTRDELVEVLKRHGATDLQHFVAGSLEAIY